MSNQDHRPAAVAVPQVETDAVRVTRWDFAPGAETGHHRHDVDYVIVPLTDSTIEIQTHDGTATSTLVAGGSYARSAPVEHNLVNTGEGPMSFVEIELLR